MWRTLLVLGLAACGGAPASASGTPGQPVIVPAQPVAVAPSQSAPRAAPSAPVAQGPKSASVVIKELASSGGDCGLDANGHVWTWKSGTMAPDAPSLSGIRSLTCSPSHACAVMNDGSAMCWGGNSYGSLGNGGDKASMTPVRVSGLGSIAEMALDFDRSCARTQNGDVYCWGDSEFGKAGDGRLPDNVGREKVLPGKAILSGAVGLGVGLAHACAVMADGRLSCWGQNNSGSCAQPLKTRYLPRPQFAPKMKDMAMVRASESVTCSLDKQGKVACWGNGLDSFLGRKAETPSDVPIPVALPGAATEIAVGDNFGCALLANGEVHCWGNGEAGRLGDGGNTDSPTAVRAKVGHATRIGATYGHACALVDGGLVYCWGKEMPGGPVQMKPE